MDDSATEKKCELNAGDCLSNDGGNGRHAVFNALDTMLKDSLERLKMMRLAPILSNSKNLVRTF